MPSKLYTTRHIPEGSEAIEYQDVNAVAYVQGDGSRWYGVAYSGKRNKPDWQYAFKSEVARSQYIEQWLGKLRSHRHHGRTEGAPRAGWPAS